MLGCDPQPPCRLLLRVSAALRSVGRIPTISKHLNARSTSGSAVGKDSVRSAPALATRRGTMSQRSPGMCTRRTWVMLRMGICLPISPV